MRPRTVQVGADEADDAGPRARDLHNNVAAALCVVDPADSELPRLASEGRQHVHDVAAGAVLLGHKLRGTVLQEACLANELLEEG